MGKRDGEEKWGRGMGKRDGVEGEKDGEEGYEANEEEIKTEGAFYSAL